jgi:hypothetical protein
VDKQVLKRCGICSNSDHKHDDDVEGSPIPRDFKRANWNSAESVGNTFDMVDPGIRRDRSDSNLSASSPISSLFQSKAAKQTRTSLNKLKSILRADDKVLLAEANELRRLTDPSTWLDPPNATPTISEVLIHTRHIIIIYLLCFHFCLIIHV